MTREVKRALSLLLALVMALGMTVAVSAADSGGAAQAAGELDANVHESDNDACKAELVSGGGIRHFSTLKAAVGESVDGDVINLTCAEEAYTLDEIVIIENAITLNLNGKTVHNAAKNASGGAYPGFRIDAPSGSVTFQDGEIDCASPNAYGAIYVFYTADAPGTAGVVLENMTVSNEKGGPAIILASATEEGTALTVDEDSTVSNRSDKKEIHSNQAAISNFGKAAIHVFGTVKHEGTFSAINGCWSENNQFTTAIIVENGADVSQTQTEDDPQGAGILMMSNGKVTVRGNVSGYSGIDATLGEIIIEEGAVINGIGPYREEHTSSGANPDESLVGGGKVYEDGSAIFLDPAGRMTVAIHGGALTSAHGHAVSARDTDNAGKLSMEIKDGTFTGAKGRTAVEVRGLEKFISGGTFSTPINSAYLAGADVYVKKNTGGSGDAAFTYGALTALLKSAGDVAYTPDSFDESGDVKKETAVNVRFNFGGGTTAEIKENTDYPAAVGAVVKLPAEITRSGHTFKGWLSGLEGDAGIDASGGTYTVPDPGAETRTVTLTAQWTSAEDSKTTYTVTFDMGGHGTAPAAQTVPSGGKAVRPADPAASGYTFDGWFKDSARTTVFDFDSETITANTVIYAKWSENKPSENPSSVLTGYVDIEGEPWVGETLTAVVRNSNYTGRLYYQWTADGVNLSGETSPWLTLTRYEVGKVIRCVVTSSNQTGSITGRLWATVDYYDSRYYPTGGSTNNNTTTGTNQGGNSTASTEKENDFTIETPIFSTATNTDGTRTTTIIEPDGSSGLVMLTSYGTVSSASMTFSSAAFANALRTGSALTLPAAVQSSRSAGSAAPVRIVLPQAAGSVKVKIPVSQMTSGTVAVMENYFGPDAVIRSSVSESDGVLFHLTGSAVVKIVDNSRSFQDVSDGAWYTNAVKWASSREVMNGVSAQRFDPQGTVNRAMMAQMLYNFDGAGSTAVVSQFSDVTSKDWYAVSVSWASRNGIARSYGNRFGAEDALTREDMAAMLYNYARTRGYAANASGSTAAFSDNGDISDWARPAMQWAVGAGHINGTQTGTRAVVLDPQGTVTRAQLATIMQRFNNLY